MLTILLPLLASLAIVGVIVDASDSGSDDETSGDETPTPDPTDDDVGDQPSPGDETPDPDDETPGDGDPVDPDEPAPVEGEEIVGDDDDNQLTGTVNDDTISGGGGNDLIDADDGNDLLNGDAGADTVFGRHGTDVVNGGSGDDLLKGGRGNDFVFGGEGDDRLIGSPGDDVLTGGSGSDYLRGDQGDDILIALDDLALDQASDTLIGGTGTDRLIGDDGDLMQGGEGATRFEVVVGGAPVRVTDFELFHPPGGELSSDLLTLLDEDGEILSRAEVLANGGELEDAADGSGVNVLYDGRVVAVIEGYIADDFRAASNWMGNFSTELTGRFEGDDVLTGDTEGAVLDDYLAGGNGDDTLTGGGGQDLLQGDAGNDVLDTTDHAAVAEGAESQPDLAVGGEGDDRFIADDGDIIGGQEGLDSYEVYVPTEDDDRAVEIFTYQFSNSEGQVEILTLLGADGTALSAQEVADNLVVYQHENGTDAILEYDGRMAVIVHGMSADILQQTELWIGNLDPDPTVPVDPDQGSDDATEIAMALRSVQGTGQVVSQQMFGANTVFSVNTDAGVPLENYVEGVRALEVENFRFPAGQGDSLDGENEGVDWLNVIELVENEDGERVLREEVVNALDAAIAAHDTGSDVKVTMVIATKLYSLEEYEALYDDIARFAEIMVTDYADQIEAIEIGNEYWAIGETNYGQKADIAARALAEGMARAGVEEDDQPSIIVQMATPNEGSEFHTSVDDRPFGERRDDANQQIIDQLSAEARAAIDGVVEHYYYRRDYDVFTGDGNEQGFIPNDYEIWEENFDKELDLHITEWNIRTTNLDQNGIRAAGILPEMMEYMVSWGTDAAHGWPVVHNTTSHLAGTRADMPILNEDGWVVNSVRGAVFDVMSSELVGTELMETEFSNDDGRMEVQVYQSDDKIVVQVASRTDELVELDLDITALVDGFDSAKGVVVGYDRSASSSDGVYQKGGELFQAEQTIINGEPYYFNEHDTRATVTNIDVNSGDLTLRLNPYEMTQMVFEFTENTPPPPPIGETPETVGTEGADQLTTGEGNDSIQGLDGDDTIEANGGFDTIRGGEGNDRVEAGRGDDTLFGDAGDDVLYGNGGEDSLKAGDGNDTLSGNQGNDTLLGNEGNDDLRGGDDNDTLNGGQGADTLRGGANLDTLTGWSGSDTFAFELDDMASGDIITDFEPGRDVISLEYDDIQSMDDLQISEVAQGIVIIVGDHGGVLLQGELTLAQVADPRNFLFPGG
ncbi:type I secretion protein [Shimia sp. R11_0]|uniref:calcium-binding protein n=1 Tax=Shimia sp. R11_0 TaxID=2821096 RepID=UPI001ADC5598|nr:calcium-binding protein [Shimia sp. R11_0]MBO9479277.1 type I secretion protein [Shimia sp. R11_0]